MPPYSTEAATEPFWRTKTLREMSRSEWESLCDGCGKCCLHKLQYDDTGEVHYTNVACRLLDLGTCQCSNYAERQRLVPDCVALRPDKVLELNWLPSTCAYRLLANGQPLAWWHPLVSGDPQTVHSAGQSVLGRVIPEKKADILDHHIVIWPA
jgi:uncharacterized cysteine cluster protein YcgN (CxxCxxCC family)